MRRNIFLILLYIIFISLPALGQQRIEIIGTDSYIPIEIDAAPSTGLNSIYVVRDVKDISIVYHSSNNGKIVWSTYSTLGGGYAEEVTNIRQEGNNYILSDPPGNRGYIINDGDSTFSFWLVDYSDYYFSIESFSIDSESDCQQTLLNFKGNAGSIDYYTISGRKESLNREITLSYRNLIWSDSELFFIEEGISETLPYINERIILTTPLLCKTDLILKGDRFLEKWGEGINKEIYFDHPVAVEVKATIHSYDNDTDIENSNQIGYNPEEMGGSAPFRAEFNSYFTDAVIHFEWQISKNSDFEEIDFRIYEQDLDYTFTEEGTSYVRFVGSNADGSCEAFTDPFAIFIGSSELKIPNAFSPNGDGINDVWKVAYRSLLEFKCWIFDRHGHKIFYFDDPSEGWDGKHGSKFVSSGVYFYVIEAKGADGKKYKKSGDINVLNSYSTQGSYEEEY